MNSLSTYGWTPEHQKGWDALHTKELQPARVIADFGTSLKIATPTILTAELSGKLAHYSTRDDTPKVGDWVAVRILDNSSVVESVVLRANEIARKVSGKRAVKQIFAANVDVAFVLLSLDHDFSVERLKRFLLQLSIHAITPVILLNKADKTDDLESYTSQLEQFKLPIITSIATDNSSTDEITSHIKPGETAILLGSSGVGKSTLTNKLLGREAQDTGSTRESDSKGRHTTVHRELFLLPGGGILIDTPGIRELQLWGTEDDVDANFDDITEFASQCKYSNCTHDSQKGCAIHKALATGALDKKHYANYLKMKSEMATLNVRKAEKSKQDNARVRKFTTSKNVRYDLYED